MNYLKTKISEWSNWVLGTPEPTVDPPKSYMKEKLGEFSNWFVDHTPETIKTKVSTAFTKISSLFANTEEEFFDAEEGEEEFHDAEEGDSLELHESESALRGFSETRTIHAPDKVDVKTFLANTKPLVQKLWKDEVETRKGIKSKLILECRMVRTADEEDVEATAMFHSLTEKILEGTDLDETYSKMIDKIQESFATYLKRGSSW